MENQQSQNFELESLEKIEFNENDTIYSKLKEYGVETTLKETVELTKEKSNLRKEARSAMLKLCDKNKEVQEKAKQGLQAILDVATEHYKKLNSEYQELKNDPTADTYDDKKARLEQLTTNPYLNIEYKRLRRFLTDNEFLCR
jgi:hypothetical protein